MNTTILTGGRIITPREVVENHALLIRNERIIDLVPAELVSEAAAEVIDVDGAYIMPGIIDIHADYIEHMAAPRPTSMMDFRLALRESERELITHGVTTMYHSLAIYDFTEFMPSPVRHPDHTRRLIGLIDSTRHSEHLIRHRFHARFEIDNLNRVAELEEYIREGTVHLISFMDHTPGQGQYRNLEIYRKTLKGYRNLSDHEVDAIILKSKSREKLTLHAIAELAQLAAEHGIAVASHDDDSLEKLTLVRGFGATISEFPITLEVALAARELGMHAVAGAPNVLLGGSHSGNLSAAEAVLAGAVDVLCSDYYPASLLHAVFQLHHEQGHYLPDMVNLVTRNPAAAVLADEELGSVEAGKRADLLIVDLLEDGTPAVTGAFVDGVYVYSSVYRRSS
jgi:alpha-D-ribose 1-methylphosphonate 5-triphosphate diphosphatase